MYTNLEEFVKGDNKLESLITYDFKFEAPWEEVRNEKHPIKRFLNYKNYNKGNRKFDCDNSNGSCSLTDSIYYNLWGWSYKNRFTIPENLKEKLGIHWNRMGSDTMNSFSTTYGQALKIYSQDSNAVNSNMYIQKFASLTHSIGNFTLVPFKLDEQKNKKSFNQYRGANFGRYFVYDYFDLSLKLIKENVSDSIFKSYIDTFYLNVYVDQHYNIKPLFKRHEEFLTKENISLENPKKFLPADETELNEYLENVIESIESRGKRMIEALEQYHLENLTKENN